ncbi:TetR/AcrR family transcriptional regulator [Paenibacillus harenae]|uniref:AcrR family transcriptional regulator n=1 Tax=Paenibacillus harenae TaxID=306543 RepID=A0ABT9U941_PAEHA|nr:TetR/AcrR family transcriptional regulator [Paenibacillus harenae]MDQ0116167.1 AcrR family transcriptional regulator [Paenibacillus harenae]
MTENDKQERIIAAAYQVLAERGYDEASTKEIARAAGVAQGLIGYYFSSKDLLFAEVFRRESERYCESLSFIRSHGEEPLDIDSLKSALSVPKSRAEDNPSWIKLRYELFALGLRNPAVSESIKDTLASKRTHLTGLIETVSKLPEEHSRSLSPILLAVFDGLGLQRLCDKDFDYDGAYDTLATMIYAYLQTIKK